MMLVIRTLSKTLLLLRSRIFVGGLVYYLTIKTVCREMLHCNWVDISTGNYTYVSREDEVLTKLLSSFQLILSQCESLVLLSKPSGNVKLDYLF